MTLNPNGLRPKPSEKGKVVPSSSSLPLMKFKSFYMGSAIRRVCLSELFYQRFIQQHLQLDFYLKSYPKSELSHAQSWRSCGVYCGCPLISLSSTQITQPVNFIFCLVSFDPSRFVSGLAYNDPKLIFFLRLQVMLYCSGGLLGRVAFLYS